MVYMWVDCFPTRSDQRRPTPAVQRQAGFGQFEPRRNSSTSEGQRAHSLALPPSNVEKIIYDFFGSFSTGLAAGAGLF